jgi:hypothetical protein
MRTRKSRSPPRVSHTPEHRPPGTQCHPGRIGATAGRHEGSANRILGTDTVGNATGCLRRHGYDPIAHARVADTMATHTRTRCCPQCRAG